MYQYEILHVIHRWVSMVVLDGLAHFWQRDICNNHDELGQSVPRSQSPNLMVIVVYEFVTKMIR